MSDRRKTCFDPSKMAKAKPKSGKADRSIIATTSARSKTATSEKVQEKCENTQSYNSAYQSLYREYMQRAIEDCLVSEKIKREETKIDIQMAHMADRFNKTISHLDKINRRVKEISFVVEQKRLLEMKSKDSMRFIDIIEQSNVEDMLQNLVKAEQACLESLQTKNVDFGYDKDSGHKQLLDAVNDAIEGFEQIKKNHNLDLEKFKEYTKTEKTLDNLEKDRCDLLSLKANFDEKFPEISEMLLKEVSEKIAKMMDDDCEEFETQ